MDPSWGRRFVGGDPPTGVPPLPYVASSRSFVVVDGVGGGGDPFVTTPPSKSGGDGTAVVLGTKTLADLSHRLPNAVIG